MALHNPPTTPKGQRGAERLLEAATVVLARDGLGGASIARIAEEAGVAKRMVTYYFGTREALLVRVVQRMGQHIADTVEHTVDTSTDPAHAAADWIETLWTAITSQPELPRAYFALVAGDWNGDARQALTELKGAYLDLIHNFIDAQRQHGHQPHIDDDALADLIFATLRGLALAWAETPDSPTLTAALDHSKQLLANAFQ